MTVKAFKTPAPVGVRAGRSCSALAGDRCREPVTGEARARPHRVDRAFTRPGRCRPGGDGRIDGRSKVQDGCMDLRIFTEPQQGASYDTLLTVAKATEDLGFDAFFRSDHYLAHGLRRRAARADRRLDHPGRARPRDQADPARHADDRRHVPAARACWPSRSRRSTRCRVAGSSWAWARAGSRRSTRRTASRSRRRSSRGWRSSWRSSPGCGPPRSARPSRYDGAHYQLDRLARAAQARQRQGAGAHRRARRDPHPAAGRAVRRRVQHPVRLDRGQRAAVRPGPRRRGGGRARGGRPGVLQRPGRLRGQGRRRGGPPRRRHRTGGGRAEGERAGRLARPKSSTRSAATAPSARPGSTSRSWTSTTSTTWS